MTEFISGQQIVDAAGELNEAAISTVGKEIAQFDNARVPSPAFRVVAAAFNIERGAAFGVAPGPIAIQRLSKYPGLRVVVAIHVPSRHGGFREVAFPGIVLEPEAGKPTRVGHLAAGPDAMLDEVTRRQGLLRPLSDMQQTLLMQLYGMHRAGVGSHSNGRVNVLDSAHGTLVAMTDPSRLAGLHGRSHAYTDQGLASSVSRTGALDMPVNGRLRKVHENVVPLEEVHTIWVAREHQLPPQHELQVGVGQLVVGTTLAAVRAKRAKGYPQPNISAGMDVVSAPLGGR